MGKRSPLGKTASIAVSTTLELHPTPTFSKASAETVLKFDFGTTSSAGDVVFSAGKFQTRDDGDSGTPGDQTSSVSFNGFFDSIRADIPDAGSFTFDDVMFNGNAFQLGMSIYQQTFGGSFSIYDDMDMLLLSGDIGEGVLVGSTNSDVANFFNQTPTIYTGGSLIGLVDPNSGVFSLALRSRFQGFRLTAMPSSLSQATVSSFPSEFGPETSRSGMRLTICFWRARLEAGSFRESSVFLAEGCHRASAT